MTAAPHPANETERLQALSDYDFRDPGEEQAYEDFTRLAARFCETPMALLSLVDSEREWCRARVGWEAAEIPREHSLSAHAILQPDELMVVSDAARDPRFDDNPLVSAEPGIRFFAAAPLVTEQGFALGALCVADRTARELLPDLAEALQALARRVMTQLELRFTVAQLKRGHAELASREWELQDYHRRIKEENAALAEQCTLDGLTGVRNQRAFDRALGEELARSQRQQTPVSILLVDIDRFKAFNNAFGRGGGDRVLQATAGLLTECVRPFDVVARYHDQDFAVILSNAGDETAVRVGDRLRRKIESAPWKLQPITVSVGASTIAPDGDGLTLVEEAEDALRHAKQSGRNLVRHAARYR